MKEGIYKLVFSSIASSNGPLDGIVVVTANKINGGDDACLYKGEIKGNKAFIKFTPHNKHDTTNFIGHEPLDIEIRFENHISHYLFKGHIKGDSTQVIHGQLNFLSSLA
ncbi:hypothetical protein [Tatumella terrea]|uniref:Type III secretion system (T3SS) negative regulator GrlR n=1 Tax=Tatumella terrea TaxID=419007 RepID=A0ABW1VW82_9GAMM